MSFDELFRRAWSSNFSVDCDPAPDLPCLRYADACRASNVRQTLIATVVRPTLRRAEQNVDRLQRQLDRERFVVRFLREVLTDPAVGAMEGGDLPSPRPRVGKCDYTAPRVAASTSVDSSSAAAVAAAAVAAAAAMTPIPPIRHRRNARSRDRLVYEEVIPRAKGTVGRVQQIVSAVESLRMSGASSDDERDDDDDNGNKQCNRSILRPKRTTQPGVRTPGWRSHGNGTVGAGSAAGAVRDGPDAGGGGKGAPTAGGIARNNRTKMAPKTNTYTTVVPKTDGRNRLCVWGPKLRAGDDTERSSWLSSEADDEATRTESMEELDNNNRVICPVITTPSCRDEEKLQMRKWVVTSILDSERTYLVTLDILMQLMQTFRNILSSEEPIISAADIDTIFCSIPDLHVAHDMFVSDLAPRVENWSDDQEIAEPLKVLALMEYRVSSDYLKNYPNAVETINRCWRQNATFKAMTKEIEVQGMKEKQNLEKMLYTPVVRFQRNSLVLNDLINCTPTSHADYDPLQKTLIIAQQFLENFDEAAQNEASPAEQRYLSKHGLVVERVGEVRKLRLLLLFNDVLVCAHNKRNLKQQVQLEVKWFIPLYHLSVDDKDSTEEEKALADKSQLDIKQLQHSISDLQHELRAEMKNCKDTPTLKRQGSITIKSKKSKIRKKLKEQQLAMIKASPTLIFRVYYGQTNRCYTLLMSSDYERATWRTTINDLRNRVRASFSDVPQGPPAISSNELQSLLNSKKLPQAATIIGVDDMPALAEEQLFGLLNITLCKLNGITESLRSSEVYCAVEVDSFNNFSTKARTKVIEVTSSWNENFEIELEGSQTVRVLVYETKVPATPFGMCALELCKDWLTGEFQEKTVSINKEMSLTMSLNFSSRSREQTLPHASLSPTSSCGVFGVSMKCVQKDGNSNIPLIVTTCIQEIESRGLSDEGLYRISGATSDIQRLKKAFEKNTKNISTLVKEAEIPALAGVLKLYFRELPESLFTDAVYRELAKAMSLSADTRQTIIVRMLKTLPEPNHSTVVFLLDHLVRVASHEGVNKMSLRNLATVFGPTLLRQSLTDSSDPQTLEQLISRAPLDIFVQTTMMYSILEMRNSGTEF